MLKINIFPSNFSKIYIYHFPAEKHRKHIKFQYKSASILLPMSVWVLYPITFCLPHDRKVDNSTFLPLRWSSILKLLYVITKMEWLLWWMMCLYPFEMKFIFTMTSFYLIHSLKNINSHERKTPASRSIIIHGKILIPKRSLTKPLIKRISWLLSNTCVCLLLFYVIIHKEVCKYKYKSNLFCLLNLPDLYWITLKRKWMS